FNELFDGKLYWLSTVLQHAAGITFAYFTNRRFVFKSENISRKAKTREATEFFLTRIVTLFIDMGIKKVLIEEAGIDNNVSAVITSVIVIVLNYFASKLYIFKRKD
ncbi:MAG TPA: teichoic acid glycosylation protein, partial [Clostridiales bacterium]|nr:teichoic acid glycosylation protein [Clostridiales bacterium]